MDREELSKEVQSVIGRCMSLEAAAVALGETSAAEHLAQARRSLVAAGRRVEPPLEGRSS
jgi:hypothetical protein